MSSEYHVQITFTTLKASESAVREILDEMEEKGSLSVDEDVLAVSRWPESNELSWSVAASGWGPGHGIYPDFAEELHRGLEKMITGPGVMKLYDQNMDASHEGAVLTSYLGRPGTADVAMAEFSDILDESGSQMERLLGSARWAELKAQMTDEIAARFASGEAPDEPNVARDQG